MLQAESLKEKTVNRKTNTDHHNGDFFFDCCKFYSF